MYELELFATHSFTKAKLQNFFTTSKTDDKHHVKKFVKESQ